MPAAMFRHRHETPGKLFTGIADSAFTCAIDPVVILGVTDRECVTESYNGADQRALNEILFFTTHFHQLLKNALFYIRVGILSSFTTPGSQDRDIVETSNLAQCYTTISTLLEVVTNLTNQVGSDLMRWGHSPRVTALMNHLLEIKGIAENGKLTFVTATEEEASLSTASSPDVSQTATGQDMLQAQDASTPGDVVTPVSSDTPNHANISGNVNDQPLVQGALAPAPSAPAAQQEYSDRQKIHASIFDPMSIIGKPGSSEAEVRAVISLAKKNLNVPQPPSSEPSEANKADPSELWVAENGAQTLYNVGQRIGSGSFGTVYEATKKSDGSRVAIKFEPRAAKTAQLHDEYRTYRALAGSDCCPNVYHFGHSLLSNILIMDRLGSSLEQLFNICGRRFTLKTVVMIGKQMISNLEELHKCTYIHRDVKPDNFLIGTGVFGARNQLYIIDPSMAQTYTDRHGAHISFREGRWPTGTSRYMSPNAHQGRQQSRRDDIEALAYIFLYFLDGGLPWQGIARPTHERTPKNKMIANMKQSIAISELCRGKPKEFALFLEYTRDLKFEQEPDYNYLRELLTTALQEAGEIEDGIYDWDARL